MARYLGPKAKLCRRFGENLENQITEFILMQNKNADIFMS